MKHFTSRSAVTSIPQRGERFSEVMTVVYEQNLPPSLVLSHRLPLDKTLNRVGKRAFDLIVAIILIATLLSWLLPLIAILIKMDSKGPVLFLQKRNSRNGKLFTCIKFRTMIVNSEADSCPAAINDHRITKIGAFLRRNHLDELPQLFNVLIGHMSLIGPRPHMLSDNARYEKLMNFYSYRHKVKPGLTGLAQVHGHVGAVRDVEEMKERVKKDIYYIHHWSFLMDLHILGQTLFKMFPPGRNK